MKTKTRLGWILIGLGSLFLIGGLFVIVFTTVAIEGNMTLDSPLINPPIWVTIADRLMEFTIGLLDVDWTPTRAGIFLIAIGIVLEGGGAYTLLSKK